MKWTAGRSSNGPSASSARPSAKSSATPRSTLDDIDLVIFHQANQRIIDSAARELGIDPRKVFSNLDRYGNTSSASIPLALDEAYQAGRVRRGQNLLLSGFGAG